MNPTIAAQWVPKGCQPQLFSDSNRERVNLCRKWHTTIHDAKERTFRIRRTWGKISVERILRKVIQVLIYDRLVICISSINFKFLFTNSLFFGKSNKALVSGKSLGSDMLSFGLI